MQTEMVYSPFPFRQAIKASAICADGKIRIFKVGIPDTFFSIPAHGKIKGFSVRGFVSYRDDGEIEFTALPNKHFSSLPESFQRSHLEAKKGI
jgi:hypothetical protein